MSSLSDVPFGLAVTNATSGDTVLEAGVTTSLTISVVNNTGASIALVTGADASAFDVYLPTPALFSTGQLNAIKVTTPGWSGAPPHRTPASTSPAQKQVPGPTARRSRSPSRT